MTRYSSANAGATKRHMFWSQPKPWANSMGWASSGPEATMLYFARTLTMPSLTDRARRPSPERAPNVTRTCPRSSAPYAAAGNRADQYVPRQRGRGYRRQTAASTTVADQTVPTGPVEHG